MIDVFICYKREDMERVGPLVEGLQHAGLSVWWDRQIPAGTNWRQALDEQLNAARCVIVVWSHLSVGATGDFVHDEAGRGKARGVLLPVRIDDAEAPLGFGEMQSLDLVGWSGDAGDPRFLEVVAAARAIIAGDQFVPREQRRNVRAPNWINQAIGIITTYVADLLRLIVGPKRFLAERLATEEFQWERALIFVAISYLLGDSLTLSLPHQTAFVTDLAFGFANMLAYGVAVYVSWRAVGATAPVHKFFTVHFYLSGVFRWAIAMMTLSFLGVLSLWDRALYAELMRATADGETLRYMVSLSTHLNEHPVFAAAVAIANLWAVGMMLWLVAGWGAYRDLAGLSKLRSALAFILFCLFSLPIIMLAMILATALAS